MRQPAFWTTYDRGERVALLALSLFIAFAIVHPLAKLAWHGITAGGAGDANALAALWTSPATRQALANTLVVATASAALSLLGGAAFALVLTLTNVRAKAVLVFCFMLPLIIAPQVTALAWIQALGPNSALLGLVGLNPAPGSPNPLYGPGGIVFLLGLHHAPLVFVVVRAGLRQVPRHLVEAAASSGAGPWRIVSTVILPLLAPALAAGTGLAFVSAVGNFGIPALLGIPAGYTVLVTLIYQRLAGFGPSVLGEVAAIGLLLAVLAAAGLAVQRLYAGRRDVRAVALSAALPDWPLGRWRLAVEGALWLVLVVVLALPLSGLFATSLVTAYGLPLTLATATVENYAYVLLDHAAAQRAFANSLVLAGGAAIVLMGVALPLAVLADGRRSRFLAFLSALRSFPMRCPAWCWRSP